MNMYGDNGSPCLTPLLSLKYLEEKGQHPQLREYLKEKPTQKELEELVEKLGIRPEELIRKKETIYKEKYAGKDMTDEKWIAAMVENPVLIERPILIKGNKAIIGRPAERVLELK